MLPYPLIFGFPRRGLQPAGEKEEFSFTSSLISFSTKLINMVSTQIIRIT